MGITYFYQWILSRSNRPVLKKLPSSVESLFFDINGLIHSVAQRVYAYGKGENKQRFDIIVQMNPIQLEIEFFQTLCVEIAAIIEQVRPRNNLFLCVDGVAPPAKINQQRSRRYKSVLPPEEEKPVELSRGRRPLSELAQFRGGKDRYYAKAHLPRPEVKVFDSNCITPGTRFMHDLDLHLQSWIVTNRSLLPPNVVYSPHLARGEGEHKIFELIRRGHVEQGTGYHVVYGLDADLTMLSSLSNLDKILLARESLTDIVNIDFLKRGVILDLASGTDFATTSPRLVIQDFVLIVYLIGNDFLPHMMAFDDVVSSMELLFEACRNTYLKAKSTLTDEIGQIKWEAMRYFLYFLATSEEKLLKDKAAEEYKYPATTLDAATVRVPAAAETKLPDPGKGRVRTAFKVESFDYQAFRGLWYWNALGPRTEEGKLLVSEYNVAPVTTAEITTMCQLYMYGLQWILQYYLGSPISQRFIYTYAHSPLLSDLYQTLNRMLEAKTTVKVDDVLFQDGETLPSPIHQLVSVLPPASSDLIPEPFANLILPGGVLNDLCPTNFVIEREGRNKEWEGVAILPRLDLDRVFEAVNQLIVASQVSLDNFKDVLDLSYPAGPRFKLPPTRRKSPSRPQPRSSPRQPVPRRQPAGPGRILPWTDTMLL